MEEKVKIKEKEKSSKNKSFKEQNKNNDMEEERINMINISNIQEIKFGNNSKNEEDTLNEINGKCDKNNKMNSIDINNNDNDKKIKMMDKFNQKNYNKNYKINDFEDNGILKKNGKKNENNIDLQKTEFNYMKKNDVSYISKFCQVKKQKEEGFYDKDSSIIKSLNDVSYDSIEIGNLSDLIIENNN